MVAGCRVLHSSATGSAQPQRLRASPPRQDQNHRASGSELPGFVPNPRDKGSRAIRVSARWGTLGHDDDLSKPATPKQFGKGRIDAKCPGRRTALGIGVGRRCDIRRMCCNLFSPFTTGRPLSNSNSVCRGITLNLGRKGVVSDEDFLEEVEPSRTRTCDPLVVGEF